MRLSVGAGDWAAGGLQASTPPHRVKYPPATFTIVPSVTLLIAGLVSIVTGASFLLVARRVLQRPVDREKAALRAYATWWAGMGLYLCAQGVFTTVAASGADVATAYLAARSLLIPLLCAGVWGLTGYFVYLYTGRRWWMGLAILYALVGALFLVVTYTGGRMVEVGNWLVGVDDSGQLYRLVYVLVGAPPLLAAFAYLGLLRHAEEPMQRYRILLVAGSVLAYIGSGLAARLSQNGTLIFVTLVVLGLAAATAALLAYYPPQWVQVRLASDPESENQREAKEAARNERCKQLL